MNRKLLLSAILIISIPKVSFSAIYTISEKGPARSSGEPSLYNGTIAWVESVGNYTQVMYWDGLEVHQITDSQTRKYFPSLYNGAIAWYETPGNIGDPEIMYWDGFSIYQITNNDSSDRYPSLYNGTIAWKQETGDNILYWDGYEIHQITNGLAEDEWPSLYNGTIAWSGDGIIMYWDGISIQQISNPGYIVSGYGPSLYNGAIAWSSNADGGGDAEIFYWDGNSIHKISENSVQDFYPSLYNGTIAWQSLTGNGDFIMYWDGVSTHQITDKPEYAANGYGPSLYNGTIAWVGRGKIGGNVLFYWDGTYNPLVKAGDDQIIEAGTPLFLDGSNSKAQKGDIVSWQWLIEHQADPRNNKYISGETVTVIDLAAGAYIVTLTVTTNDGYTGSDTLKLKVNNGSTILKIIPCLIKKNK